MCNLWKIDLLNNLIEIYQILLYNKHEQLKWKRVFLTVTIFSEKFFNKNEDKSNGKNLNKIPNQKRNTNCL